jgi:hypothetical protein
MAVKQPILTPASTGQPAYWHELQFKVVIKPPVMLRRYTDLKETEMSSHALLDTNI